MGRCQSLRFDLGIFNSRGAVPFFWRVPDCHAPLGIFFGVPFPHAVQIEACSRTTVQPDLSPQSWSRAKLGIVTALLNLWKRFMSRFWARSRVQSRARMKCPCVKTTICFSCRASNLWMKAFTRSKSWKRDSAPGPSTKSGSLRFQYA